MTDERSGQVVEVEEEEEEEEEKEWPPFLVKSAFRILMGETREKHRHVSQVQREEVRLMIPGLPGTRATLVTQ